MKSYFIVSGFVIFSILIPSNILAHPGRAASDGCHYCRTNCDNWSVGWNVRHCHNGYPESGSNNISPVTTKKPVIPSSTVLTPKPTVNPTITSTKVPTFSPVSVPEVVGESTEVTTKPVKEDSSTVSNPIGSLIGISIFMFAGYKGLKWLKRNTT